MLVVFLLCMNVVHRQIVTGCETEISQLYSDECTCWRKLPIYSSSHTAGSEHISSQWSSTRNCCPS